MSECALVDAWPVANTATVHFQSMTTTARQGIAPEEVYVIYALYESGAAVLTARHDHMKHISNKRQ